LETWVQGNLVPWLQFLLPRLPDAQETRALHLSMQSPGLEEGKAPGQVACLLQS
jgi:hypothetical protein